MSFFISEHSIRGGNRGGKADFDWESVRLLNHKERDCYLGASVKLGYLDKGHKWRKKDWWLKQGDGSKKYKLSKEEMDKLEREIKEIQEEEKREMEAFINGTSEKKDSGKLTDFEIKKLTQKTTDKYAEEKDFAGLGLISNGLSKNGTGGKLDDETLVRIKGSKDDSHQSDEINTALNSNIPRSSEYKENKNTDKYDKKDDKSKDKSKNKYLDKYKDKYASKNSKSKYKESESIIDSYMSKYLK